MTATTNPPSSGAEASLYQQLRAHLANLKLTAAAEALPTVLDQAQAEGLGLTAALERLLAIEVDATEARRLAGRLRFASIPTPATLEDFDHDAQPGGAHRDRRCRAALGGDPDPAAQRVGLTKPLTDHAFVAPHHEECPIGAHRDGGLDILL